MILMTSRMSIGLDPSINSMPFTKGQVWPNQGIIFSDEWRSRISTSLQGRVLSEESRNKIRLSKTGQKQTKEAREKLSVSLKRYYLTHKKKPSKPISEETREKLRQSALRNGLGKERRPQSLESRIKISNALKGERAPNWRGGISTLRSAIRGSVKTKIWREAVFARDGYACITCNDSRGGNLEADHIIPFWAILEKFEISSLEEAESCEFLWSVENGRTLCTSCHRNTSTWGHVRKEKRAELLASILI